MASNNNIPENDRDLLLSEAYGKLLDGQLNSGQIQDSLYQLLNEAKVYSQNQAQNIVVKERDEAFKSILEQINQSASRETPSGSAKVHTLQKSRKWVWTAAAVALILFTSLFLLRQSSEPASTLIANAESEITRHELQDGSIVTLRPNSKLYLESESDSRSTYSMAGEAFFEVTFNPDRDFIVETSNGRVRVLGTTFNLNDRNNETSVYLIDGRVLFETSNQNLSVTLSPGEAASIKNDNLSEPFNFEEVLVTSWTQNRLTFSERSVGSIIDELEFHYDIEIEMDASDRSEILGGSITLENLSQSLSDLETVLDGEFVELSEDRYRFRNQ